MIVVDASVAIKWLRPEDGEVEAQALLSDGQPLTAPSLIHIEVSAAVIRLYRLRELSEAEAQSALERWNAFVDTGVVTLIPVEELFEAGLAIAFAVRHNLQDCLYVAAGRILNARLITADKLLHQRCRRAFKKIELLPSLIEH